VSEAIDKEVGRYLGPRLMRYFASTDLFPWLEYSTPKGAALGDLREANTAVLARHRGNRRPPVRGVPDAAAWDRLLGLAALRRGDDARGLYHFGRIPPERRNGLEPLIRDAAARLEPQP